MSVGPLLLFGVRRQVSVTQARVTLARGHVRVHMVSQLFLGTLQKELSNIWFYNAVLRKQAFFPAMPYKQVLMTSYLKRLEGAGLTPALFFLYLHTIF